MKMRKDDAEASKQVYLEGLINTLNRVIEERDRLYDSRFRAAEIAVQAALLAQKEGVANAFLSSEKAIVKAEEAQLAYNQAHNDLSRKMDEQNKGTMPRPEILGIFKAHDDRAESMRLFFDSKFDSQRIAFEKSIENVNNEVSAFRDQLVNFVSRGEFVSAKDQAAGNIKSTAEHTALLVTRVEFEVVREQFIQSQKTSAERSALYMTRDEVNTIRQNTEKLIEAMSKEIVSLREYKSATTGRYAGLNTLWGYIVAVAGIALALIFHYIK